MRIKHRIFSILLSLALVVAMVPAFGVHVSANEKLATPEGGWNGLCIQWKAVPNATEYNLTLQTVNPNDILGAHTDLIDFIELKTDGSYVNRVNDDYIHNPDPYKVEYDAGTGMFTIDCTNLITVTTNEYWYYIKAIDKTGSFDGSLVCTEDRKTGQELMDGYQSEALLRMNVPTYVPTHIAKGFYSIYASPGGGTPFAIVNEGRRVTVTETQDGWSKIIFGSGYGWIKSSFLEPIEHKATHVVIPNALNVRKGPGSDWGRIGGVPGGREVEVTQTKGEWSQIVYGNVYGWVQSKYLEPLQKLVNPFVDVFETDEYYDAVLWAYYATPQITNGIDTTHFGPKQTVTRGQCAAFLWRAMGEPEPKSTYNPFVDVPAWQYYYKPILWAVENGITKGTDATHYSPDQTLKTAHIITFMYRMKNPGKDGWYTEAASWAGNGYGGKPFGVNTAVNDITDCPRAYVVMFLKNVK